MRQDSLDRPQFQGGKESPRLGALKVPFGLKDGRMWGPKQVPAGRLCGCICPACLAPLIAKAAGSEERRPHFAHQTATDCRAGYETALHKKAKELLEEHRALLLPLWDGEQDMPNPPALADLEGRWWPGERVESPARNVSLTEVRLEVSQGDYTPDAIASDAEGELLVEIRVTHAVDPLKRRRIQAEGRRLLEIDLSKLDPGVLQDEEQLVQAVLFDASNRVWLSCPEATEAWRTSFADLKARVALRNQEILQERHRQEEFRLVQQQAAEQTRAHLAERQANRERFRQRERERYARELEALPALVSVPRIDGLLEEFLERDGPLAEQLIAEVPYPKVQEALRYCDTNAWIYTAHPSLWQAACYQHFVLHQRAGQQFNKRDVARWVMQEFGREEVLYALFLAQYRARARARNAGFRKYRISFWAFTELENRQIPDFYKPINTFIDRLVYLRVLQPVTDGLGEVRNSSSPRYPQENRG